MFFLVLIFIMFLYLNKNRPVYVEDVSGFERVDSNSELLEMHSNFVKSRQSPSLGHLVVWSGEFRL